MIAAAALPLSIVLVALSSGCRPRTDVSTESRRSVRPPCARLVDSALVASRQKLVSGVVPRSRESLDFLERRYFLEFEVTNPATRGVMHAPTTDAGTAPIVQFVVDRTGAVDTATVKVIWSRGRDISRTAAVTAVRHWRFGPALIANCRVAQLVEVPLP